ncbi:MAG: CpaD family pilus assembly protein [Rhodospirillales bacterium]
MPMPRPFSDRSWRRFVAPVVVSLALAACAGHERSSDVREAFPIVVGKETVALTLAVPAGGADLTGQDALNFERFVIDYHHRGRKTLTIAAGGDAEGRAGAERLRALLRKAGVRGREISVTPAAATGKVVLSFTAHKAQVPECGDFSSEIGRNPYNRPSSNYGCATQRNLGLTVRDPADLEEARPLGGGDATKGVNVIGVHRLPPQ